MQLRFDDGASVENLLGQLAATAALPLERAQTLPPELYWRPDIYALECERIFSKEWMCVARAEQLPHAGDYLGVDLAGEPLLITRDENGSLHALSRICRHRYMDLLTGAERRGNVNRVVCPYHLWSYKLNGQLAGAPEMGRARDFDRAGCRLPEIALEVWQGFVFVNLDPAAAPLAPRLRGLEKVLGEVDLSPWVTATTVEWGHVEVNWKLVIENGAECYHHMGPHRDSLQPIYPAASVAMDHTDSPEWFYGELQVSPAFSLGECEGHPIHPTFLPPAPGMSARQRSTTLIAGVFPMFFFALSPDFASWFHWLPTGPTSHSLDIEILVPPSSRQRPDFDEAITQARETLHAIQSEDARINAGAQRGCRAATAAPGRLSHLEQPLWQFQRYLANRLTGGSFTETKSPR